MLTLDFFGHPKMSGSFQYPSLIWISDQKGVVVGVLEVDFRTGTSLADSLQHCRDHIQSFRSSFTPLQTKPDKMSIKPWFCDCSSMDSTLVNPCRSASSRNRTQDRLTCSKLPRCRWQRQIHSLPFLLPRAMLVCSGPFRESIPLGEFLCRCISKSSLSRRADGGEQFWNLDSVFTFGMLLTRNSNDFLNFAERPVGVFAENDSSIFSFVSQNNEGVTTVRPHVAMQNSEM